MSQCHIVIVAFRNVADIIQCLGALDRMDRASDFAVWICENGGPAAFDQLRQALNASDAPTLPLPTGATEGPHRGGFIDSADWQLRQSGRRVILGLAPDNLGYAGGISAWLEPLMQVRGWHGAWILNPDTEPAPDALAALQAEVARSGKGMVGSRVMEDGQVRTFGLHWSWLLGRSTVVGRGAPVSPAPDPDAVAARMHAPSGASTYITRDCVERIGLPDARYFLYFEDLEWGYRAALLGQVGYAHASVVEHEGGTTTGASRERWKGSVLSVYLNFRNRFLFVRSHRPSMVGWTFVTALLHAARYVTWGTPGLALWALRGIVRGLAGETGPPDLVMRRHVGPS